MSRVFQIFRERGATGGAFRAVPSGISWAAVPLPWLWAFRHRLWGRGLGLLMLDALGAFLSLSLASEQPVALVLLVLAPRLVAMVRGSAWRAIRNENSGLEYLGEMRASGAKDAIAQVARRGGQIPPERRPRLAAETFAFPPRSWQRMLAVARLTIRAAFRYRLIVVLVVVLLAAVLVLPMVLKHDGTAEGFTQILLTYTLGVITALLSMVTLWLACGTLARDVDDCQMQVVATKPIPRWQIWVGKWIGILIVDALLLTVSAGAVFFLMQWRAKQLPPEVQQVLHSKVLTARASVKEPPPDINAAAEELIRSRLPELQARGVNLRDFRTQVRESLKARSQVVPPDHFRRYRLNLRGDADAVRDQPVFVRLKFHTPELSAKRPYEIEIDVGPPDSPARRTVYESLAAEAPHEIALGPVVPNPDGSVTVDIANRSDTPLIFPVEDGFEFLYREGGFGLNFVRALLVILCWLGLLAAIGLAAASFLSFPVAAFLATTVLVLALSTGTLKSVVEDNTVLGFQHDSTERIYPAIDAVLVPIFRVALKTVNVAEQFSPIDSVSSGRSITWGEVARATGIVVLLLGGVFAALGIATFTRRELATAESHH